MTLLDASALLSLLLGQPGEEEVFMLLRRGNCATPAPCLSKVVDRIVRKHRVDPAAVSERLGALIDEEISVISTDPRIAWRAGELRATHYDRRSAALSLAGCILLATAESNDEVASSDGAVIATAGALGIATIPLLDSTGRRPAA